MPKISQFPSGGVAQNTDLIPVVRNGGDYTITGYNLASLASYGQAYVGTFTATAGQKVFTLPSSPGSSANLAISVDGLTKVPGTDYNWTTPTTLTFTTGLTVGQTVLYRYTTSVPVGTSLAGGTNNQIQYNNSGVLNGFTMSGDVTVVPTTGVATIASSAVTSSKLATGAVLDAALNTSSQIYAVNQTYNRTAAEISAGVTPTNYGYQPGDVRRYGATGNGTTDDTIAIQNAIAALGQLLTSNPNSNTNPVTTVGGGRLFFPKGKYKVTSTLTYSGGMIWEGEDWGSYIQFTPSSSLNCVAPSSTYTWGNTQQQFVIRNMFFTGMNSNAAIGLYLANTDSTRLDKVTVSGFNTYNVWLGQQSASSSYYNLIIDCYLYDAPTNLYLDTLANATNIIGGAFTHTTGYASCNYNVIVKCGGAYFSGTSLEGKAKIAQVQDTGIGTTLLGVYYEDSGYTSGVPLITHDYSKSLAGNTTVQYIRKGSVALTNFPESGADSDPYEQFVPMTVQRGFPKYVTGLVSNGNFYYGLRDWFRYTSSSGSYTHGTCYLDSYAFLGKASIRIVHDGTGLTSYGAVAQTIPNRMFSPFVGNGTRLYVHVLVKFENEADSYVQLNMNGSGITNKFSAYRSMSYGSGLYLYTCNTPLLTAADLQFVVQCGSTTAGRQFWVCGAWATIGGLDPLACPTQDLFTDTASPSTTAYATWPVGATVYNGTYASGQAFGWICKTAGTNGTALSSVTANTTSGSTAVTFNDVTNLGVGMYITIAGVAGTKRIATLSGTSGTLDSTASATVTGGAVAYSNATFGALFTP